MSTQLENQEIGEAPTGQIEGGDMNNIEKVKKIPKQGMYFSDRCQFCGEFGEKIEPYLCEKCRDRIFEWLNLKGWSILQGENRFEPKPNETAVVHGKRLVKEALSKPSKSRLLTDEGIMGIVKQVFPKTIPLGTFDLITRLLKAQRDLTAPIVDKQARQEMVARLNEIDKQAYDEKDFTRRVCDLIVEYEQIERGER